MRLDRGQSYCLTNSIISLGFWGHYLIEVLNRRGGGGMVQIKWSGSKQHQMVLIALAAASLHNLWHQLKSMRLTVL